MQVAQQAKQPRRKTVIAWSVASLAPVFEWGMRDMTQAYAAGERDVRLGGELATRMWTDIERCKPEAHVRMLRSAAARLRAQIVEVNTPGSSRGGNCAEWEFAAADLDAKADSIEFGESGKRACNYPSWWQA